MDVIGRHPSTQPLMLPLPWGNLTQVNMPNIPGCKMPNLHKNKMPLRSTRHEECPMQPSRTVSAPREYVMTDEDMIISKTDTRGKITYANRDFMRICGYSEPQLLGQPHSLIRHPDMPRGAFRLMWKTLQAGQEFFAVVKNLTCGNAYYYWVLANVTPDFDTTGQLKGYYSVRRRPSRTAIETLEPVYARMREIESQHSKAEAPDASMNWLLAEIGRLGFPSYESLILELNHDVLDRSIAA